MFDHFFEWFASRSNLRFRAYREARLLYEAHVREFDVQFDKLTPQHHKQAIQDERLRRSEQLYRQAIELSWEANAIGDLATGLYQLGMLLHLKGRFRKASQSLQDSLRILEDLPRPEETTISGCYYHLGLIALRQGCVEEARRYVSQSLEIDTAIGDVSGISLCRLALAKCDEVGSTDNAAGAEEGTINKFDDADAARISVYDSNADPKGLAAHQLRYSNASKDALDITIDTTSISTIPTPKVQRESPLHVDTGKGKKEQETGFLIGSAFSHDVVWLLSHSAAVNDRFMDSLEQLARQLPRRIIVTRAAFGSQVEAKSTPPPLAQNERLCAAILVVEKEGLENENFRYWANWCIRNVTARGDFRLFVCLDNLTTDEIENRAKGDQLCATLLDTVQLLAHPTSEHLRDTLKVYLQKLDDIYVAALWRRVRIGATAILGRIAGIMQLCCGVALGTMALLVFVLGSEFVVARLTDANNGLVAIIAGVALFPLVITPLFLLFQGPGAANLLIQSNPRIRRWLILFALFGPATIGVTERVGAPLSWIVLGVVVGILLDVARRKGYQAQRANLSLQKALEVSEQPSSAKIAKAAIRDSWDPLRCPLAPAVAPRVFISYTLWSDWSSIHASDLHDMLCSIDIDSFRDQAEIGEGSSWRSHLNRSITDANVFVAVLDETAVTRKWVAAEMITALVSRQLTGLPAIIVLTDSQLSQSSDMLPVFRSVLQERDTIVQRDQIRFVTVKDSTLRTLVWGLHPHRYSTPSILPSKLTDLLSFLTIPAVTIGAIGPFFGLIAALFAYLQYWDKVDSSTILSSWGILTVVYLICGYWLGFDARLSFAARFDMRHTNAKTLTWIHVLSSIGFLGILAVWYVDVSNLISGWAVALCGIGWLVADLFIGRVRRENSDFRRPGS